MTSTRTSEDLTRMVVCAELGCLGSWAKLPEIRNKTRTRPSVPGTVNFSSARILFPPQTAVQALILLQTSRNFRFGLPLARKPSPPAPSRQPQAALAPQNGNVRSNDTTTLR